MASAFQSNAHQSNAFQITAAITNLSADVVFTLTAVTNRQISLLATVPVTLSAAFTTVRSYVQAVAVTVTFGVGTSRAFAKVVNIPVVFTASVARGFFKVVNVVITHLAEWALMLIRIYPRTVEIPLTFTVGISWAINYSGTPPGQWNKETRRPRPPVTIDKVQG
jgi:hypothetical protein